uniref:Cytochrome c6 n=1 Tax=Platysiphonia delicata TaxID=2006979 RepID=A0A1Z1M0C8_9FLOR|nr:cytochrome c553 [Platysiphonia delicata]ARW59499.1 cytochrome c553 [Platysiphonia delicata]
MKNLLKVFILYPVMLLFLSTQYVSAEKITGDIEAGEEIFNGNCAACHLGGKNLVEPSKTLEKEILEVEGMYSMSNIISQVTYGKRAMPAFAGRISNNDIENVASYVLTQSDKGW